MFRFSQHDNEKQQLILSSPKSAVD